MIHRNNLLSWRAAVCWRGYRGPLFSADKPNIVLIVSDDQAWTDYGFMGHDIETPHLDRLAGGFFYSGLCSNGPLPPR